MFWGFFAMSNFKICTKCGVKKEERLFRLRKDTGRRRGACLTCEKAYFKTRTKNPGCAQKWYEKNKDVVKERVRKWKKENPDKVAKSRHKESENRKYRNKLTKSIVNVGNNINDILCGKVCNKCDIHKSISEFELRKDSDKYRNTCKRCHYRICCNNNKDNDQRKRYMKEYFVHYRKRTYAKIAHVLRSRIRTLVKGKKGGSAVKDLGCSMEFFISYMAEKFKPGMTWDNHGKWHIDHIKPLSLFDLEDREQFLKACHYTNLQPLWAEENLKKSNKLIN